MSTSNTEPVPRHRVHERVGQESGILCPRLLLTVPGVSWGEELGTRGPMALQQVLGPSLQSPGTPARRMMAIAKEGQVAWLEGLI